MTFFLRGRIRTPYKSAIKRKKELICRSNFAQSRLATFYHSCAVCALGHRYRAKHIAWFRIVRWYGRRLYFVNVYLRTMSSLVLWILRLQTRYKWILSNVQQCAVWRDNERTEDKRAATVTLIARASIILHRVRAQWSAKLADLSECKRNINHRPLWLAHFAIPWKLAFFAAIRRASLLEL